MEGVGFHDIEQSLGKIIGMAQIATPRQLSPQDTALGERFAVGLWFDRFNLPFRTGR